ncbi:MAG: arsenite methyltransferase [Chloroflexi bacterium]|nr:arsenite methyltransferase [Chloroflexota bacterium]
MTQQPIEREIREAVVGRYAARARAALESAGVAPAAGACCAPGDAVPAGPTKLEFFDLGAGTALGAACDPNDPDCAVDVAPGASPSSSTRFGTLNYEQTEGVPAAALAASAGCGNPVAIAELRPGESVLDLGSGGGVDCFFAAHEVGASGQVWGLDMTPEMIQLARHNATQVDAKNVRFRLGEIEDIPFADASFDAIISNCVINLSTDKPQVFREAFRVLRPGGRLRVSDMVWTREVPAAQARDAEQWAGCIAGALRVEDYLGAIRAAGFVDVDARYEETESGLTSAYVSATRP